MANVKISQLTVLAPPAAADELVVVDVSATSTKKTTVGEVVGIINGDVEVANNGTATISELPVSKLQDGAARQLLQTDAAGTGVEWASNVDIPGTLDVTGTATFDGSVTIAGDLTVNGTTATISTQNLLVEDKNIIIGDVATPTDVTADGGGITLKGATDKTINWVNATDAWTSSERFSVPLGTAALPSLTFTGDANTGIYSPGADQLAISTGGGACLIATLTGLGIGTTPDARLTIQDGANIVARVKQLALNNYSNEGPGITFGRISDGVELSMVGVVDSEKLLIASREGVLFGVGGGGLYSAVSEAARFDPFGRLLIGTSSESGGALLQVNGDRIRVGTAKTPASATATGTAGEICWDADYIYVCTAANTWKRTAITTW